MTVEDKLAGQIVLFEESDRTAEDYLSIAAAMFDVWDRPDTSNEDLRAFIQGVLEDIRI